MTRLRIATRGSQLALAQAAYVAARAERELSVTTELVVIKTSGDLMKDVSLAAVGGKGLFVKEIEEALLADRADVAVHSAKDLPARLAPGTTLAAFPERADPRDALVVREPGTTVSSLRRGARIGTGSARRRALLLALRPDLEVVALRGNVPTRIAKLESNSLDAVVLAVAGLVRLDLAARIGERISPEVVLPAVCQGTLALQTRADVALAFDLAALGDPAATLAASAERSFLAALGGDCNVPIAALAESHADGRLRLRALVASADGQRIVRTELDVDASGAEESGRRAASAILEQGGAAILAELQAEPSA